MFDLRYDELPSNWYHIIKTDEFLHVSGFSTTKLGLDRMYRHLPEGKRRSVGNQFLEDFPDRKLSERLYVPGNPSKVITTADGRRVLNTWRKPDLEPCEGDVTPLLDHFRFLVGYEEKDLEHLLDMIAFMIQNPGKKLKSAIIFYGNEGTGKSFVAYILRTLVGYHNSTEIETYELKGNFNDYMDENVLVVIEELMAYGKVEILNSLKPKITQEYLQIHKKHQDPRPVRNTVNFVAFTNHINALSIRIGDRRYFIVGTEEPKREDAYYEFLWDWAPKNFGAILHYFQNRDLSGFSPNKAPHMTKAKKTMIAEARPAVEIEIERIIKDWEYPFNQDLVEVKVVVKTLSEYMREANTTSVRNALRNLGAVNLGQKKVRMDGEKAPKSPSLWAVRNQDHWDNTPDVAVARAYLTGKATVDEDDTISLFEESKY